MSLTQITAYGLTLTVEGVAALLLAPRFAVKSWRAALAAVLSSAISHPIFWWAAYALVAQLGALTIPSLEALVVLFESLFYRLLAKTSWRTALILSVLVNFVSWLVGEALYALR